MKISSVNLKNLKKYFEIKPVRLAYLMGSQAGGQVKPYSDVDIAVLFNADLSQSKRFKLKISLLSDLSRILDTDNIDLIDLQTTSSFFAYEAIKKRKELFVRDQNTRIDYEIRVLSDYFDRTFFQKRHSRLGLQNLKEEYGVRA